MSKRHPLAGMQRLCDLFGKRRQSWYEAIWQQEDKHLQEAAIIQEVLRMHQSRFTKHRHREAVFSVSGFSYCSSNKIRQG
jgi:hypothetical protein